MIEIIPCNLDPRRNCPANCPLYSLAESLLRRTVSSGRDLQKVINAMRAPDNADILVTYREGQSVTLRNSGLIESCHYYPESDITIHPVR